MQKVAFLLFGVLVLPVDVYAQGAAPELFGVREVIVELATLDDIKASDTCGISQEKIATAIAYSLSNTTVPAIAAVDAKPPSLGVARIHLIPEVYTYANESLDCISWVSLSAQSRANAVIPPVSTLRSMTLLYWQQHTKVVSGESLHEQRVTDVLQRMTTAFAQQYRLDQPPDVSK